MEREHYRRVSPPRSPGRDNAEPARARRPDAHGEPIVNERLIVQGIVSGLILAAILVTRLVDNGFTQSIQDGLRQALSGQTTVESVLAEAQRLGEELLNTDFLPAGDDPEGLYTDEVTDSESTDAWSTTGTGSTGAEANGEADAINADADAGAEGVSGSAEAALTDAQYYIDEEVLAELNARTASNEAIKSPVPEPSASPEP